MVFRKKNNILFEENDGHIFVIKLQNHWTQRALRKMGIRIPEKSKKELDDYGTLVFREIDGVKTVRDLGELLAETYEESQEYLYERLLLYLHHLETVEKWIELT